MSQPYSSQIQKPVKSSRTRRRLRGLGLAMSIQLCLLMFGGCTAAGQPAASGSADPTATSTVDAADPALSASPDDPDTVIIHLYDCSRREHVGVFASINRILKERGLPYRIQVTSYHKTVWSGCEKQRARYTVEYIKEHQPETAPRFEAEGFDELAFFLNGLERQGYDIDREWQGVEETRLYLKPVGPPVNRLT